MSSSLFVFALVIKDYGNNKRDFCNRAWQGVVRRSSSLNEKNENNARNLNFLEEGVYWRNFDRSDGFPVRAVLAKKAERKMYSVKFYTSDSILIESQEVLEGTSAKEIQAPEKNGYEFVGWSSSFEIVTSDLSVYALYADHSYVDLGLPSGTLWATYNIGATKPEEYGDYFAWGETEPKEVYDWSTYKYATLKYDSEWDEYDLDSITKYNMSGDYGIIDSLSVLLPEDDAATANWGKEWRMPTNEEQRELYENSYMVWTYNYNGTNVEGVIFYKAKSADDKGKFVRAGKTPSSNYSVSSDAHVFLPASGYRWDDEFYNVGFDHGCYWSSSLNEYREDIAFNLCFYEGRDPSLRSDDRIGGYPVRAVRAK